MSEISKEDLEKEIAKILKTSDLASTSSKKVRQRLEKIFSTDLTSQRKVIDGLVMDFVNNQKNLSDEDYEEEDEEEEEEEEEKKPVKRPAPAAKKPSKKARKASSSEQEDGTEDSDSEAEKKKKPAPKSKGKKRGKKGSDAEDDDDYGKKQSKAKKGAKGRGKGSGYTRAYKLSPALAELMGQEAMPRHEVVKRVWAIIKEKKLYDPNNKHFAICDDALYKVIGTKRFRAFGMMKYLKTHFLDD